MAENSKIEWCHHTFNPWRGCRALSEACANCYAKVLVEGRLQQDFGVRTRAAESTWKQPLSWNRKAAKEGVRYRVFCASLADVFDAEVPDSWRDELFALIAQTPHLDWLLLTKRPKVMRDYFGKLIVPHHLCQGAGCNYCGDGDGRVMWKNHPLPNVWLGTTVENQAMAAARIPHLLATPAAVRFLSMEPLLGPVDLTAVPWSFNGCSGETVKTINALTGNITVNDPVFGGGGGVVGLDWIITGGESGPGARPSHPDWFRSIRDQCAAAGVPYLHKQWGEWAPGECATHAATRTERTAELINDEWRFGSLSPQASQEMHRDDEPDLYRVGKARAGRWLDGVLHDGYPVVG